MNPTDLDWPALERLRELFLTGSAARGPYWRDARDLAAYDATYAERIGWKWDAVLAELTLRGWHPTARVAPALPVVGLRVLDWGCGSGVAGRRVVAWLGGSMAVARLDVWDHAALACEFATARARARFPGLAVGAWQPPAAGEPAEPGLDVLVLSHVANELSPDQRTALLALVRRAGAVLWVEPGTRADARALQRTRDELRDTFRVIAPCPHDGPCGLLAPARDHDWCHHFARPPAGIQADGDWVRFAQRAGIDLRSLPYACLVLESRLATPVPQPAPTAAHALPPDAARVIGRPEHFKPYARLLACRAAGCADLEVPKRSCVPLYKHLEKTRLPLLYRLSDDGTHVTAGEPLLTPPTASADPAEAGDLSPPAD